MDRNRQRADLTNFGDSRSPAADSCREATGQIVHGVGLKHGDGIHFMAIIAR